MMEKRIKHIVVDAGGFIKDAPVAELGETVYTVREVVSEIRDKPTRARLQVLPYELMFVDPSPECIAAVTEFAKKTGDYRSLSAVDIRLMALVYQLEKQHCGGIEHIKTQPNSQATWTTTRHNLQKPTEIAGFYLKPKPVKSSPSSCVGEGESVDDSDVTDIAVEDVVDASIVQDLDHEGSGEAIPDADKENVDELASELDEKCDVEEDSSLAHLEGEVIKEDNLCDESDDDEEEEDDDDDDDDDAGWITPSNIATVKRTMGHGQHENAAVTVGCLTLDFCMQNVLIQMGLSVVSVDGMLIRKAKSYVQRCSACMKITAHMEAVFCPTCGHSALRRLAMTVDSGGAVQYCFSKRHVTSARGLNQSLPAPQGGKYAQNPILCADQPVPQQRLSRKARTKYDVFEAGYEAYTSPFAPKDIQSRSVQLGFHSRKNKSRGGRRK